MNEEFLAFFDADGAPPMIEGELLRLGDALFPIRNGIPRFVPDVSYSANFRLLRERHAVLQLDSANGTTHRRDTILERTRWPASYFQGKTVLECGCGAGPDTEVLLSMGARVLSVDLAGVDIAKRNVGDNANSQFIQASITELPLKLKSFDIVYCHRVLQHTPTPAETLGHILQFVKDDGAVFVHSYAKTFRQMFRWKYWLLPITRRLPAETLYGLISRSSTALFHITNVTNRTKVGRVVTETFVPFLNYRRVPALLGMSDSEIVEYGVHDTFDALSPRYDKPISSAAMRRIAASALHEPFEIDEQRGMTLLRTLV